MPASCESVMVEHMAPATLSRIAVCTSAVRLQMLTAICWRGAAFTGAVARVNTASAARMMRRGWSLVNGCLSREF